jgi:hypothetical protein
MAVAPLPDAVMSAVELIVTVPVLAAAKMPSASVTMIANGPGLAFRVIAPLLVKVAPVTPAAGAMLVVRLLISRTV